jgi:ATP-dependent Clp protease ATP-binding subunit ClpA
MWEPFTERARRSIVLAQEEAQRLGNNYIGTEHILLGIISEGESLAAIVLGTMGVNLAKVRAEVEALIGRGGQAPQKEMVFTARAQRVIELAFEEARQFNHNYIGTEHLLLGLIREGEGIAAQVLTKLGVNLKTTRQEIVEFLLTGAAEPISRQKSGETQIRQKAGVIYADPVWRLMTIGSAHAVLAAKDAAVRRGTRIYDTDHLLYGIAHVEDTPAAHILAEKNITPQRLCKHLGESTENIELSEREIIASEAVNACFQMAVDRLASMSRLMLDPEMLLYAMIEVPDHRGMETLKTLGADVEKIRTQLKELLYGRNT